MLSVRGSPCTNTLENALKKLIAPLLFGAALLTGCAGTPAAGHENAEPPAPSAEQRAALLAELEKVNPDLARPSVVAGARAMCRGILEAHSEEGQLGAARYQLSRKTPEISDEDVVRVVAVIKANGFCTLK